MKDILVLCFIILVALYTRFEMERADWELETSLADTPTLGHKHCPKCLEI